MSKMITKSQVYGPPEALANLVEKAPGKGLSTNDYTDADKTKLGALPTGSGMAQTNNVIAEAITVLYYELNALIEKISDGSLHLKVASIDAVDYGSMGTPIMTEGDGAPSFVPTIPGQGYFNKTQNKWYKAKMTLTNSIGDWIALN